MREVGSLRIRIFADGANLDDIRRLAENPLISGFTTNPTLMKQCGVRDYLQFAHEVLLAIPQYPISFEVFSDDEPEMERQARLIASWGDNVFVKIPVTNTYGESTSKLIRRLAESGVNLNVTALLSLRQVYTVVDAMQEAESGIISVFAGRIADTGRDPIPIMSAALELLAINPGLSLLWASPRELLNVVQADSIGCHIITVTPELLTKVGGIGRDLEDLSLDTVRMFERDAREAGFRL